MQELKLDLMKEKMKERGITTYQLIKLTGIKKSTLYSYFAGTTPITPATCARLADAIDIEITEVFPSLNNLKGDLIELDVPNNSEYKPLIKENDMGERSSFTEKDMVAGAATITPTGGYIAKIRQVVDHLGTVHDNLLVQNETQVTLMTGIKAPEDIDSMCANGLKKHIMEHEAYIYHTAFSVNGELCVSIYVHGKPLMLCRGAEIAKLMYR